MFFRGTGCTLLILTESNFLSWHSTVCYFIEIHAREIVIYLLFYMLPFSHHRVATSATLAQIRAATLGAEVCYEVNREH